MANPYPDSSRIGAGCSIAPFGVGDDPDLYPQSLGFFHDY
jgi:hypothetical protein